jgi:hypothetical protein
MYAGAVIQRPVVGEEPEARMTNVRLKRLTARRI